MSDLGTTIFHAAAGGHSDPVPSGGIHVGTIKHVNRTDPGSRRRKAVGKVTVFIEFLGTTHKDCDAVRGPETFPYVKGDKVLCVFLDHKMNKPMILGRYNRLPINRMVGINVSEPEYPVHIGGQTAQTGSTLKIDATSYNGSNTASLTMHKTQMGTDGSGVGVEGDWFVYDLDGVKYNLHHSGHSNVTNGGLTVRASGTHTTPSGTVERYYQFSPTYDWGGTERGSFFTNNLYGDFTFHGTTYQYGCHPTQNNQYTLGYEGVRWSEIFCSNGTINTSDQNEKTDIADCTLGLEFINALRPVKFKWIETEGRPGVRTHYGLLGQEVETVLGGAASDTAIWTNALIEARPELPADPERNVLAVPAVEEHYEQGLRYTELIGPMIKALQEIDDRVNGLGGAELDVTVNNAEQALNLAQQAIDYCQSFDAAWLAKAPVVEASEAAQEAALADLITRVEALEG